MIGTYWGQSLWTIDTKVELDINMTQNSRNGGTNNFCSKMQPHIVQRKLFVQIVLSRAVEPTAFLVLTLTILITRNYTNRLGTFVKSLISQTLASATSTGLHTNLRLRHVRVFAITERRYRKTKHFFAISLRRHFHRHAYQMVQS